MQVANANATTKANATNANATTNATNAAVVVFQTVHGAEILGEICMVG